jgi:phage/plasmid-like protein (TIGR03299 family)
MAHLVEQMAYVGATPWHGLGNRLTQKQPLEVWQREAGMNWQIQESPVHFKADTVGNLGTIHSFPEQKVLYRSDTKSPLSVVSNRYQVVQPHEVLEFYRDLTEVSGYELETAGILKGGRKFWALARTGQTTVLKGNDQVNGYLLLATSCDGTLATTATPTTVRVVCNNTLTISLNGATRAIKVPHNTRFDPQAVKKQLGIAVSRTLQREGPSIARKTAKQRDQLLAVLVEHRQLLTSDGKHFTINPAATTATTVAKPAPQELRACDSVVTSCDQEPVASDLSQPVTDLSQTYASINPGSVAEVAHVAVSPAFGGEI